MSGRLRRFDPAAGPSVLSRGVEHRRGEPGARCFTQAKPGKGEHGNVVVLAKRDCSFGSFRGVGLRCEQGPEAIETIELAVGTPCFEQTVGVKGEVVSCAEMDCR